MCGHFKIDQYYSYFMMRNVLMYTLPFCPVSIPHVYLLIIIIKLKIHIIINIYFFKKKKEKKTEIEVVFVN